MIEQTFCHIPGITLADEKSLWDNGILRWEHFLEHSHRLSFLPSDKVALIKDGLKASQAALQRRDLHYFKSLLNPKEHWRLHTLGKIAYIDIETTGLSRWSHEITLLGIYDGQHSDAFVRGINLEKAHRVLKGYDFFVTYNGKQFDVPFIEKEFGYKYTAIHLDLRYLLRELGLQGGLKKIERQLGMTRNDEVANIDGFEAVRLWRRYSQGDEKALEILKKYNQEDIVNLKQLLNHYVTTKSRLVS